MLDAPQHLADRVLTGAEFEPSKGQLCGWITAIGTAIGLGTGAAATAAGLAVIGGGLGAISANISSLVNEVYPWEDPGQFFKASAIGLGTGAAGGAIGGAIGPVLGAAADTLGLASNIGTAAAEAGVPSGAASLSGQVPKAGVSLLTNAGSGTPQQGILAEALGKLGNTVGDSTLPINVSFPTRSAVLQAGLPAVAPKAPAWSLPSLIGETPAKIARSTITDAGVGAIQDRENPLRGALTGVATGVTGNIVNLGAGQFMKGQTSGFWSPGPTKTYDFMPKPDVFEPARMSLLTERPSLASQFSLKEAMEGPGVGGRLLGGATRAVNQGAQHFVGGAVGTAMTPDPMSPYPPNPYLRHVPYWARRP